jgi:hypothetical protein
VDPDPIPDPKLFAGSGSESGSETFCRILIRIRIRNYGFRSGSETGDELIKNHPKIMKNKQFDNYRYDIKKR